MKKLKYLRSWLVVALVVTIIGSLTGGTVAWFTDSVESTSNIVKTGTLDVEMSYADKLGNSETPTAWQNADSGAIFDYKYWEPGYTQVRYVKIENVGDLAFKFKMNVKPSSALGAFDTDGNFILNEEAPEFPLEGVIDVYMLPISDGFVAPTSFADLKGRFGDNYDAPSILDLIGKDGGAGSGVMLPAADKVSPNHIEGDIPGAITGQQTFMIALHMQEEADNRYQNMSIGDGFALQLEAAQFMYETDSFDEKYDSEATYANLPSAVVVTLDETAVQASTYPLQAAYMFRTTESPDTQVNPALENNPYLYWHADFVVSFDNDVAAQSLILSGQYDIWDKDKWYNYELPQNLKAGEEIRLLAEAAKPFNHGESVFVNYAELLEIQKFNAGAFNLSDANNGTTMTVELRIYETEEGASKNIETGYYETLGTFTYKFEEAVDF